MFNNIHCFFTMLKYLDNYFHRFLSMLKHLSASKSICLGCSETFTLVWFWGRLTKSSLFSKNVGSLMSRCILWPVAGCVTVQCHNVCVIKRHGKNFWMYSVYKGWLIINPLSASNAHLYCRFGYLTKSNT